MSVRFFKTQQNGHINPHRRFRRDLQAAGANSEESRNGRRPQTIAVFDYSEFLLILHRIEQTSLNNTKPVGNSVPNNAADVQDSCLFQ